jgi:membrane protease YdiL (CAAX protease family)
MTSSDFLPPRPELPESFPPPEPPQPPKSREMPLWGPFAVMGIVFIVVATISAAVIGIVAAMDKSVDASNPPDSLTIILTVVQDGALVLAAFIAVKLVLGSVRPADLGLVRVKRVGAAIGAAAALYAAYWVASWVLTLIFGNPPDQELVNDLKHQQQFAILFGYAALTCVVAPLCEEIFFRGYLFTTFARKLGPVWGALLAGGLFGAIHAPNPILSLVALGVLGVCLCALYWRTGSIIPGMALHALNNSISFGYTKSLDPALYAGLIVGSVALVIAVGTAVSSRPEVAA